MVSGRPLIVSGTGHRTGSGGGPPDLVRAATARPSGPSATVKAVFTLFVFTVPFEAIDILRTGHTFSLPRLIGFLMIGAALTQAHICFARPPAAFWLFAFYLATSTVVGFTGPSAYWQLAKAPLTTLAQMLILFWISSNLLRYPTVARATIAALAAATLIVGFLAFFGIGAEIDPGSGRLSMFEDDPNSIAAMLSLGILAWAGLGTEFKGVAGSGKYWVVGCVILAAAIVRTGSRGGVIALLCGILALLFRKREDRKRAKSGWIVAVLVAAIIGGIFLSTTSLLRWQTTLEEKSASGREAIFPIAWAMFLDRPLVGWGPVYNIAELGARMGYGTRSRGFGVRDTHNGLLWVLTETGIVGFVPYVLALWLCLRSAWRGRARAYGVLPFAMTICVLMINMSLSWQGRKFFWLILGLAAASSRVVALRAAARPRPSAATRFEAFVPEGRAGLRRRPPVRNPRSL